jgi:hypothetical protein
MERAGYTKLATRIALKRLVMASMVSVESYSSMDGGTYYEYAVTDLGANYILSNQHKVELQRKSMVRAEQPARAGADRPQQAIDDEIPF